MTRINVDKLRRHLQSYCGSAAFSGFPAAAIDLIEVESASDMELCHIAERMGIDLRDFSAEDEENPRW